MAGTRYAEHIVIRTPNVSGVVDFYSDILGLRTIRDEDGIVYLGCGIDDHFDIALTEGHLSMDHVAMRVDNLDKYEDMLRAEKIPFKRSESKKPNVKEAIAFKLPNGANAELVTVEELEYLRPNRPKIENRAPWAPYDLDHVTLHTTDCKQTSTILQKALGLYLSDARDNGDGTWGSAFLRYAYHHHDIAFLATSKPEYKLNHVAFALFSTDHMKMLFDRLSQYGYSLESGPVRHIVGNNVSSYFWVPDGNRVELTCEVAEVSPTTPPKIWPPPGPPISGWGGIAMGGQGPRQHDPREGTALE